jgi:hypothetical protein
VITLLAAAHPTAYAAAVEVLAAIPNPGQGTPPPGSGGITTVLGWVAWVVFACCVGGLLMVAGKMALEHSRGGHMEMSGGVVKVIVAAIIAGSASGIIGAVLV